MIAEFEFEEETMMIAIIGASTFSVVIILSVLLICGLPLGELTMGGRYKVFPKKLRIVLVLQLVLQMFFVIIILLFLITHRVISCK